MLQNLKDLSGLKLAASDGDLGRVKDFYFDDLTWSVRYVVADTGTWLSGRQVLLSPHAFAHVFGRLNRTDQLLQVNLTRKQIENSPSIETHKPVSRQYEEDYYRYFGWPTYWYGGGTWDVAGLSAVAPLPPPEKLSPREPGPQKDGHLRSVKAVKGYAVEGTDGSLGVVSSFQVDDKSWAMGEMEVEAGHWFSGREILIQTRRIARISYEEAKVFVNLTKADIRETGEHEVVVAAGETPAPPGS